MDNGVLGRTNQSFPSTWLSLVAAGRNVAGAKDLIDTALEAKTVIDISSGPALWGGQMRGTNATLMMIASTGIAKAMDEQHAHDLVQAHLIEVLSSIGRENIDLYFLSIEERLQEMQISGALIALEEARQEGNVRFVGIAAKDIFATQNVMHFHDAFELLLLDESNAQSGALKHLAKSRRVAIVTKTNDPEREAASGEAILVRVKTPDEIRGILKSQVVTV